MIGPGSGPALLGRRRWLTGLTGVLGALVCAGCGMFRTAPLDVPPGHSLVLGAVVVSGFSGLQLIMDIGRDDGSFTHELPLDADRTTFVVTLPPGRYRITRVRLNEARSSFPEESQFRMDVEFEVREPAVYVGTLRVERVAFARRLRVSVQDEYDRAVPAIRGRHPDLPAAVGRALMRSI